MSNKIRELCQLYKKDILSQVRDRDLQRKLSDDLNNLLNKIEFSERIAFNVESSFDSYLDRFLDAPIDYESIDTTAREMGCPGGIKVRAYNGFNANNINTYGDLLKLRKDRLNRVVRKEARERYSKDFEKLLANVPYRNFGVKVAKVLVAHLKSIGLINYFQD